MMHKSFLTASCFLMFFAVQSVYADDLLNRLFWRAIQSEADFDAFKKQYESGTYDLDTIIDSKTRQPLGSVLDREVVDPKRQETAPPLYRLVADNRTYTKARKLCAQMLQNPSGYEGLRGFFAEKKLDSDTIIYDPFKGRQTMGEYLDQCGTDARAELVRECVTQYRSKKHDNHGTLAYLRLFFEAALKHDEDIPVFKVFYGAHSFLDVDTIDRVEGYKEYGTIGAVLDERYRYADPQSRSSQLWKIVDARRTTTKLRNLINNAVNDQRAYERCEKFIRQHTFDLDTIYHDLRYTDEKIGEYLVANGDKVGARMVLACAYPWRSKRSEHESPESLLREVYHAAITYGGPHLDDFELFYKAGVYDVDTCAYDTTTTIGQHLNALIIADNQHAKRIIQLVYPGRSDKGDLLRQFIEVVLTDSSKALLLNQWYTTFPCDIGTIPAKKHMPHGETLGAYVDRLNNKTIQSALGRRAPSSDAGVSASQKKKTSWITVSRVFFIGCAVGCFALGYKSRKAHEKSAAPAA